MIATTLWDENYGQDKSEDNHTDAPRKTPWYFSFTSSLKAVMSSTEILLCGIVCSLFEGSMYIFVFMWTPAMKELTQLANPNFDGILPFGLIFAAFMVCAMIGSSTFSILIEEFKVEQIGLAVFSVATCSFCLMISTTSDTNVFLAFLLFEVCVGIYFPAMGTMKSVIVPENKRTTIYNLYRIPLNFIVVSSLLTDLTYHQSFILCAVMMSLATALQFRLIKVLDAKSTGKATDIEQPVMANVGNTELNSLLLNEDKKN